MSDNPFALSNIEPQQDSAPTSDNPFALGTIQRDQRQDLRVNLESAVRTNPQQAAEAARLAKKYETPDEVLLRNLQDIKLRDAVAEADKKLQTSPRLADYMRTSPFALKQAHDDIDALASIEKFFTDSWGSVKAGAYNANRGAAGLFQAASEVIAPPLDWMESMTSIGGNPLRRLAEGFALNAQQSQASAKAVQPKTDGIVSGGVQSGIQSLTQNVLALPVAVMNPGAGLGMMSGFAGGQSYSDAREKGLTTNQALPYAASQAAIEAATEKIPLGKLLDSVKEGTPFFKSLVQSMAAEIPGEQVATVLQDLNEWAVLNPEKPFSSYLEERPSAAAQTLIATIVGTGGNVAVVKAAESVANRMTTGAQKARDAQVSAAGLVQAMQAAEASTLRTNNPDEFRAVMEHLAQDGKVYVDAQVLNQLPPEQLQALGVTESLPEALAANSSVEVKLSDLLTHAPGTPAAQVLIDNARATPDGLSAIEAQQASDQAGEFIKTEAERVLAEAQDATAWQDSTNKVKQGVLDQLNSAGRFSPEVNEAYATLQSSFFSVMAQRLGTTPEELFARYNLRVEAKLPGQGGSEILDQGSQFGSVAGNSLSIKRDYQPVLSKAFVDGGRLGPKQLSNIAKSVAGFSKADRFGSVPALQPVLSEMRRAILDNPQVLDAIVSSIPVDVVNDLAGSQSATKVLLHNEAMLQDSPAFNAELPVSGTLGNAADTISFLMRQMAFGATELKGVPLGTGRKAGKTSATGMAGEGEAFWQNIPFQKTPRATYSPSQVLITLNENADLSSFLHESGHFFLEVMADLASQPDAPAGVVDDFNTFLKWAGVKGDENVGGADSGAPLAQTSDVSERVLQAEQIIAGIDTEEQTVLYHSGDASIDAQLAEGIDPTFGPWLEEVLAGAVDDADTAAAIREQDPVAFYSEEPTWVAMKVAKVLSKPVRDVTVDDIRQHGQISIVVVDQDDRSIWREQGDGTAEQFTGKARRSYTMNEVPFGVERGDVFTTDAFVPEITLTGDDLVHFLQRNAPGKNNLPKAQAFAQNGPTPEARPVQVERTPLETWNAMTLDQKRPFHEKWAESFEQYLLEGKAPTAELQPLFRRFSAWLKNVYKSLTEFMRSRNLQVSDEIRGVFDRMLAAEDQIKAAEQAAGMMPDFDATSKAIEKLQARSLRDLKWTVGARSKALKALQREATNLRKAVKAEVTAEVEQMPEFKAQREIAEFKRENKRKANDVELAIIAEANGFESVDAMNKAIDLAGKKADMIEGKTDQRMLENFGELATPEALEAAANDAVHNEARARALATELKAQADMLNPRQDTGRTASNGRSITVNALTAAAKQFAQNLTARRRVKDLKNAAWQHRSAESRAAKAWQEATAKGKTEEAVAAKRDQLLNNYTAKAMGEAQAEVRKVLEFFAKVTKGNNEKLVDKGRDPDVVNAARAVLAAYDIAPRLEKSANDYMEAVAKYDAQMYGALKPGLDAMLANAKPFGELTVDEMRALRDEIGSMWELAKTSRQMEIDGDRVDIDDAAQDLVNRMVEIGVPDEIPGEKGAITNRQELGIKLQFAKAILSRVEQWAERMDGKFGGPFLRYVFQPVKDAADRYRAARVQYREKFTKLVEGVAPFIKPGPIAAPELGYTFGNARDSGMAELLHALIHTGNDSNKRKLLLGRNWATENADGTLDTTRWDAFVARLISEGTLRKEHYDFAQGVWDLLEETKPLAQEAHRKVFGRYFAEVTANEFTTPFGVYRGGYAPAQTDSRLVGDAKLRELAEGENESMAYAFPSAPNGFTKSRVEYNKPLLLDLRALAQHMDKVLLFSHMQPAISDARRLLTRKNVSYALDRIDPGAYEGMLTPWLARSAKQIVETPIAGDRRISRFMGAVRSRAGMALMMANLSNTVQQITGFSTAAIKVKPGLMLKAVGQFTASPKEFKRSVAEASPYMKDRMLNELSSMNDVVEQILVDPTLLEKGQAWTQKHAYFLQSAVDNTMSPIIWTAAYNQAIEEGSEARDAVRFADGVIRQTQGSTLPEDVSRFETGDARARFFTQFIGYFNMMANTNATAVSQVANEMGLRKGAGKLLYIALVGLLVPIWVAEAIAQAFRGGPGDEDDDGYLDDWLMAVFGLGTIRGLTATVPIAGQGAQMIVSRFNNNPADDKFSLSPAISLIESSFSSPFSVYNAIIEDGNAQKAVRDVAAAATLLTGLPFYAAARPVGYAAGVAQGKIEPTDAVDVVRGTVTGTASKESKTP